MTLVNKIQQEPYRQQLKIINIYIPTPLTFMFLADAFIQSLLLQVPSAHRESSGEDHSPPPRVVQHPPYPQSHPDRGRPHPPITQPLQPAAVWEETAESPGQDQRPTEGQLLPLGCQSTQLHPCSAPISYMSTYCSFAQPFATANTSSTAFHCLYFYICICWLLFCYPYQDSIYFYFDHIFIINTFFKILLTFSLI